MKVLQGSKAPEILLLLYSRDKLSLSDIIYFTKGNPSIVTKRIQDFKDAGLISEKRYTDFTRKREFTLTDKGRRIADLIAKIEKILTEA